MRESTIARRTLETDIEVALNLDGAGTADVSTGVGFFDHMLTAFARHGCFDLSARVKGDYEVDDHHTVEDTGIVLGAAFREALADKKGISGMRSSPWMRRSSWRPSIFRAGARRFTRLIRRWSE